MSRLPTEENVALIDEAFDDVPCLPVQYHLPPRPGPLLEDREWSPISSEEFRLAQKDETMCATTQKSKLPLNVVEEDSDGILVRMSSKNGARQRVVSKKLRERVVCLLHYPKCAGHRGRDRISIVCGVISSNVYEYIIGNFVLRCPSCTRKNLKSLKRTSVMKLFPPSRPLKFVAIDILAPLPKTESGNRFVLVIGDRYSKVNQAVPLAKIYAHDVAHAFFKKWIIPYGFLFLVLSGNGSPFAAKVFQAECAVLGIKKLFASTYHPL